MIKNSIMPKNQSFRNGVLLQDTAWPGKKLQWKGTVNPLCPAISDEVEDTEHFLLRCDSYSGSRSDFLNSLNARLLPHGFSSVSNKVLLKFILYREKWLTIDTNKKLPEATLKFIHASERF